MYHYIRELRLTRFPGIKALLESEFKNQLEYLEKFYEFVTMDECIDSIYNGTELPRNAALLTFDDAYIDHFNSVFPILNEKKISGCFFPPAQAIIERKVLDVNKIHFILASVDDPRKIVKEINKYLDYHRADFKLKSNEYYYSQHAKKHPWMNENDSIDIVFIKTMLQVELQESLRNNIVDDLFKKYVSDSEESFARELYMDINQIKCMVRNGMYFGSHGFTHYWLSSLDKIAQKKEISLSLEFLNSVGAKTTDWSMCYPKGSYNDLLIETLKETGCKVALTTNRGIASLNKKNAFTLERLDTNDLPKIKTNDPNSWTKKVL